MTKPGAKKGARVRERRRVLRRRADRIAAAAYSVAEDAWRKYRARCVSGYLFIPLTTDHQAERVAVAGRPRPHADVGSLVDEAGGAPLDGRATRFSVVDDGHGAASMVMGSSTEDLVGLILTRSDRGTVTLHGRLLVEAGALDYGGAVAGAQPRMTRDAVEAFRAQPRRDAQVPAEAFEEAARRTRRTGGRVETGGRR